MKLVCESVRAFISSMPYSHTAHESLIFFFSILFVKMTFQTIPVSCEGLEQCLRDAVGSP